MKTKVAIHWFRQDLRLADNPSLLAATTLGCTLPIYILDDVNSGEYSMGSASRWWLHHALNSLNSTIGQALSVYKGDPLAIIEDLLQRYDVEAVFWNRCYEPWRVSRDTNIKTLLQAKGIQVETYNASLLWEPWKIKKDDGSPYKVFTPFYRKGCLKAESPRVPMPKPENANYLTDKAQVGIDGLDLLPKFNWDKKLAEHWEISEQGAKNRLQAFIASGLHAYKEGRNFPAKAFVSRLSPYLHFGQTSPNTLWYEVSQEGSDKNIDHFCSELGWREFSYSQLYHNPELPNKNLQSKFDNFPWRQDKAALKAWQRGETGVPIVDAGMRQLWQTGYMHNRVRMIVGSFLVKNLLLDWRHGERWFFDKLVDADLASNSASWQWVAGCGADAAPYFRVFNPITQGHKFDPDGEYVRKFVPELAKLPNNYIFNPWEAPSGILKECGIELGSTYPAPIVDIKKSRDVALQAFQSLKKAGD